MDARLRRAVAMAMALALSLPGPALGQLGPEQVALARLARESGSGAHFELAHKASFSLPVSGRRLWAGKFVDPGSGAVRALYIDGDRALDTDEIAALERRELRTLSPFERKADRALRDARASGIENIPLSLWLDADTTAATKAVFAARPSVARIGDRPDVGDARPARRLRQDLYEARAAVYADAEARAAALIRSLGGRPGYASSSAPLIFAEVPASALDDLAARPEVRAMGGADPGGWSEAMAQAGPTVKSDWAYTQGYRGAGTRVAVIEYDNVRATGDLSGKVVAWHSTKGSSPAYDDAGLDHPSWVAGAVASQSSSYRGTAPAAGIVSSSTGGGSASLTRDEDIIAATDWAIREGRADVVNTSLGQDTATGREMARTYFDSIVWEASRVAVSSAGNYSTFSNWDIVSPGTGWNVLTVGGTDDKQSASWSDDVVWYTSANGSCYRDPRGSAWNAHGDFNKPNVSAPAVNVRTANGLRASGTSVSTPIASGVVAELIARNGLFLNWPEIPRALVMAGAIHRTPMPSGSLSNDHEGAGTLDAEWSHRILDGGPYGGFTYGALGTSGTKATIGVAAGQHVRVALAWDSHTSGSNLSKTDVLAADLDLRVTFPDGAIRSSLSFDNNYELVDYTPSVGGIATATIVASRFDTESEPFALAWTRWPTVASDTESPSEPTDFVAVPASPTSVDLSWSPSTDNQGAGGYGISRDGRLVATVAGASWTDEGLSPATTYAYSVVAYDAAGNLSAPATTSATTPDADPAATEAPTEVDLSLTASPGTQSLKQGSTTSYKIVIERTNLSSSVDLSLSGLPAGASAAFSPDPTTGASSTLMVTTSKSGTITPTGTYTLTVTGTGEGVTRTTAVTLRVTDGIAPAVSSPVSRLYAITKLGISTLRVKTNWSASDPSGIAGYQLQRQVNGGSWSTGTLSSATATSITQALSRGDTWRYGVRATDGAANTSAYVYGRSFVPRVAQQGNSRVTYGGTWKTAYATSHSGGSVKYSKSAGAWATYTFKGASVAWVAEKGSARGKAKVYLDGVYQTTVNLYAASYQARRIVFAYNWSANGSHTLKIVVVGTAGHPRVDVDAFARLVLT